MFDSVKQIQKKVIGRLVGETKSPRNHVLTVLVFTFSILLFFPPEMYHLLALLVFLASAAGDGNFKFSNPHVTVEEAAFTQARFDISRTGSLTGQVILTCKVRVRCSNKSKTE